MSRGRATIGGTTETNATARAVPKGVSKLKPEIRTTSDLMVTLEKLNICELDLEEFAPEPDEVTEDMLEEDTLEDGIPEGEDLGEDDEDIDFAEAQSGDPFDLEDRVQSDSARYVVQVVYHGDTPIVTLLTAPAFDTKKEDQAARDALYMRANDIKEMARLIATRQKEFFLKRGYETRAGLAGLNQAELVAHFEGTGAGLAKEHVSRMLRSLFFKIPGIGEIPASSLFERTGSSKKLPLTRPEKLRLAKQFRALGTDYQNKTEGAKVFWKYIKDETGIEMKLSDKGRDEDRYRHLRNILKEAEELA